MTGFAIAEYSLDNGLRVVVSEDHSAPVIALNLSYCVGSRNDPPGRAGLAHLFEHLMFQGSQEVGAGEHMKLLAEVGATANAATGFDRTSYYETVPSSAFEFALWLEADRMASCTETLTAATLDSQRDVVKNERRQRYENVPYGTSGERMFALAFPPGHHYRHMPIGAMTDLDSVSMADLRSFGRTYYSPDNAVLTLVGDLDPDQAFLAVRRYFDDIPPGPQPPPAPDQAVGPIAAEVRAEFCEEVPAPALFALHRLPAFGTEELIAAELAVTVLGGNSGLARALIHRERVAQFVEFQVAPLVGGNSVATLKLRATGAVDLRRVQQVVDEQLAEPGFRTVDLVRAKALRERAWLENLAGYTGRAEEISRFALLLKDPSLINGVIEAVDAIGLDELEAVAQTWLRPSNRVLVWYPTAGESR
jgi:zinc protease